MISMRENRDCGLTAEANYLGEVLGTHDPEGAYAMIRRDYGYPDGDGFRCDLWDSPTRHAHILAAMTGEHVGMISDPQRMPGIILVRKGLLTWHWVCRISEHVWHDGYKARSGLISGCSIVLGLAVDGDAGPLPWHWRLWGRLTSWT